MLARSVCIDFDVVGVVNGCSLASVDVDKALLLGRRSQMRVDNVNAIRAFQHARISRNNATLLESVVLHEGANGSCTKLGLGVKVLEILFDGT